MSPGPAAAKANTVALIESLTPTSKYDNNQSYKFDPKASDEETLQDITRSFGVFWDGTFEYVPEARPSSAHPFSAYTMTVDVVIRYKDTRGSESDRFDAVMEDSAQLLKQLPRIAANAYDTANTGLTLRMVEAISYDDGNLTVAVSHRLNLGS